MAIEGVSEGPWRGGEQAGEIMRYVWFYPGSSKTEVSRAVALLRGTREISVWRGIGRLVEKRALRVEEGLTKDGLERHGLYVVAGTEWAEEFIGEKPLKLEELWRNRKLETELVLTTIGRTRRQSPWDIAVELSRKRGVLAKAVSLRINSLRRQGLCEREVGGWVRLTAKGREGLAELRAKSDERLIGAWRAKEAAKAAAKFGRKLPRAAKQVAREEELKEQMLEATADQQGLLGLSGAWKEAEADRKAGVVVRRSDIEEDPVAWVKHAKPKIECKEEGKGLIVFEPTPLQCELMRMFARGDSYVVEKARQVYVTTAGMIASAHQLLYGRPFHGHVVANKETVAVKRCLRKARRALEHAELTEEQRRCLILGGEGTTELRYKGEYADNSFEAHAAAPDVGRSCDGTHVLLEEFAYMPYAEEILGGMSAMLDEGKAFMGVVSTYAGDGDTFCTVVDNAKEMGLTRVSADWRVHPKRDKAWREAKLAEYVALGMEDVFYQEYELARLRSGEQAIDWQAVEQFAKQHEYIGRQRQGLHKYAKGVDQASTGGDKTVAVIIDTTVRPAQVVDVHVFKYKSREGKTATTAKIEFIEALDKEYPGPLFIDASNEPSVPVVVQAKRKTAVRLTAAMTGTRRFDKEDKIWRQTVPRTAIIDGLNMTLGRGRLVLHPTVFPDLFAALKTARKNVDKRLGKFVDEFDALLLANLALTRDLGVGDTEQRGQAIIGPTPMDRLRGRRW